MKNISAFKKMMIFGVVSIKGIRKSKLVMLWRTENGTWILTQLIGDEHNHGLLAKQAVVFGCVGN